MNKIPVIRERKAAQSRMNNRPKLVPGSNINWLPTIASGTIHYANDGKPHLPLPSLQDLLINPRSEEEFSELIRVLECAGRTDREGQPITTSQLIKPYRFWNETTLIKEGQKLISNQPHIETTSEFYHPQAKHILGVELFYDCLRLSQELREEIHNYFTTRQ